MSKLPAPPKKITDPKFGNWWSTAGHELQKLKKGKAVEALLTRTDGIPADGIYYETYDGIVSQSISGKGLKGPKPINLHLRPLYYKQNNLTPAKMKAIDDKLRRPGMPSLPLSFYQ